MTDELKPCPFCGSPAEMSFNTIDGDVFFVSCIGCGIDTEIYRTKPKAIAAWNTRHEPDELPEWVKEAIEDIIQEIFDIMSTNPQGYFENCKLLSKVQILQHIHSLRKPEVK